MTRITASTIRPPMARRAATSLPTGTRVRAAYGTGVKNPGYYELYGFSDGKYIGNPNLKPEKSKGWEAGVEQSFADGKATIGATYFRQQADGRDLHHLPRAELRRDAEQPDDRQQAARRRAVRQRPPLPAAAPRCGLHLPQGTREWRDRSPRPGDIASFNATVFSKDERFSGTLTVRYNGKMTDVTFTDPTFATSPLVTLKAYTLVNLSAEYKASSRISLYARVENLFDTDYEEVFSYATPGIAGYGGVRVRF
jgi:vitamin B12 transporter